MTYASPRSRSGASAPAAQHPLLSPRTPEPPSPAVPLTDRTAMTDSEKVSDSPGPLSDHPVESERETESTNTTGHGTEAAGVCPVIHGENRQPHPTAGTANENWWPNRLNLKILA